MQGTIWRKRTLAARHPPNVTRLRLNLDQACGANLDVVLDERRRTASEIRAIGRPGGARRAAGGPGRIQRGRPDLPAERCGNTRMFRHSPWRGSAFSSGCSGENWFPSRSGAGRTLVSKSDRLFAGLCEGARASGGNLFSRRPDQRRRSHPRARDRQRRPGSALAAGRRPDRARKARRGAGRAGGRPRRLRGASGEAPARVCRSRGGVLCRKRRRSRARLCTGDA